MHQDDEVFSLFLEEAREHLETIETDLLLIEEQGESLDSELINKVFRDIHTVKGGAGFFGLDTVQNLAHSMENLLGKMRDGDLHSENQLISLLLDGSDLLRNMIHAPDKMESFDASGIIDSLKRYLKSGPTEKTTVTAAAESTMTIHAADGTTLFSLPKEDIVQAQKAEIGAIHIFLLEFDLMKDIHEKGKTPWDIISLFSTLTHFIDSKLLAPEETLEAACNAALNLPFYILCSTVMGDDLFIDFAEIPAAQITHIIDVPLETPAAVPSEVHLTKQTHSSEPPEPPVTPTPPADPVPQPAADKANEHEKTARPPEEKGAKNTKGNATVRLPLEHLEKLMTLAGELVLTRNELLQKVSAKKDRSILETAHRVDDITSEIQEAIMATRMQSVGVVLSKFKRIVRDLSRQLSKQVELSIIGEEVELDRTIVEAIGDPLTHIVRNAVDHGIEMPSTRELAGKDPIGHISIIAEHRAGQVVIVIQDNGAGINPEILGPKAVEKGIITSAELAQMPVRDIYKLIFKPGFSTAAEVTDISGRGVGMDVVLSSLSSVGGTVEIDSKLGKGTTFTIVLPLTLAIVPSLLLESGGERFAIPQVHIVELVRIKAAKVKEHIERLGNAAVLRLRGDLLPLVRLSDFLEMDRYYTDSETGEKRLDRRANIADRRSIDLLEETLTTTEEDDRTDRRMHFKSVTHIAIVSTGNERYGIIVDSLLDSEEIVVKPLGAHLVQCKQFAGATILGDGQVALILDVDSIRQLAIPGTVNQMVQQVENQRFQTMSSTDENAMLTLNYGPSQHLAIHLDLVTRIERISHDEIEVIGNKLGMKYRGDTLVLLKLEESLHLDPLPNAAVYSVVVFEFGGHEIGILASDINDILTPDTDIDAQSYTQQGLIGTTIIDNTITMIVDLFTIGRLSMPELVDHLEEKEEEKRGEKTVLVVDDSPFFLKQLETVVSEAGYQYISATDGSEALATLKNHSETIGLVITDVEMPNMTGLELTSEIREDASLAHIPVIACTTLSGIDAEQAGFEAGVNEYLVKIDREQILETCKKYLHK